MANLAGSLERDAVELSTRPDQETNPEGNSMSEIVRSSVDGVEVTTFARGEQSESYLVGVPCPGDTAEAAFERVRNTLVEINADVAYQQVFAKKTACAAFEKVFADCDWPVTWVEPLTDDPDEVTGIITWAFKGVPVKSIDYKGRLVGRLVEATHADYLFLGALLPTDLTASKPEQSREVIQSMSDILAESDMTFDNVVRTWFFNDDILSWYDEFNEVRTGFWNEWGVFDSLVPASTGIGGPNPIGAALTAGLLAVKPKSDEVSIYAIPSPMQCPALKYGSSFSRAVQIDEPGLSRILISGTASIEPGGKTVHLDDTPKQIDLTMRVAGAILASRGMSMEDMVEGIVYFRYAKDTVFWHDYCTEHGLKLPVVASEEIVCRDDLLFEIELEAAATRD